MFCTVHWFMQCIGSYDVVDLTTGWVLSPTESETQKLDGAPVQGSAESSRRVLPDEVHRWTCIRHGRASVTTLL